MKWWVWILIFLSGAAGIIFMILAGNEYIDNPIIYLRGDLATIVFRGGLTISFMIAGCALYINRIRKKHKQDIQQNRTKASEERRRFLQRLDHELKNPLTAITTGLTNVDNAITDEDLIEEVMAVKSQVKRISRLVSDLRKLAALETIQIEETDVNIGDLLTDVVSVVKDQPNFNGQELTLVVPSAPWPLPNMVGDPDLLLLAFHNLLDNAIKFTAPGDTIEVRAFEDGNDIVVEVADTGPGIPGEEIAHVWEELYRGKQARGIPGSGLGLPLVRAIIELHGGSTSLRSRPDQGSVFNVRLPITKTR